MSVAMPSVDMIRCDEGYYGQTPLVTDVSGRHPTLVDVSINHKVYRLRRLDLEAGFARAQCEAVEASWTCWMQLRCPRGKLRSPNTRHGEARLGHSRALVPTTSPSSRGTTHGAYFVPEADVAWEPIVVNPWPTSTINHCPLRPQVVIARIHGLLPAGRE